jgi:hypothetical protein
MKFNYCIDTVYLHILQARFSMYNYNLPVCVVGGSDVVVTGSVVEAVAKNVLQKTCC